MFLVLNLGLKSIRAIVFDCRGKIVSNKSKTLTTFLNGTFVEQNAEEWWEKGIEVIRAATENDNIRREVKYLTVTASSCCVVPVNSRGEPTRNVIMVSDKRAGNEVFEITNKQSYKKLRSRRADFEVKSSLMLPKILWLKNNERESFDNAHYILGPNDYFGYRFTEQATVDTLNAEKCFYDIESRQYPLSLLEELEIPVRKMPEVVDVGTIVSQVTTEFKSIANFNESQSIEYVVSTYDAICAFYGSGACEEGDTSDVSGTVTSLRTLSKGRKKLKTTDIFSQYQREFDISIVGGSNNLGGGLIEWAKQAFYAEHNSPYELMESEARKIEKGADGVIFLPYLMGERAPLWNDNARGVFFGLARNHNRSHMIRAVFESSGFSLRSLMEEIEGTGLKISSIKFSGGLSRIHLIARIKADILGKEIHIVDEYETTALGAFMLMGISTKIFHGLKDASSVISISEIIIPDKEAHEMYSEIYTLYKSIYRSLLDCYASHSKMREGNIYRSSEIIENM